MKSSFIRHYYFKNNPWYVRGFVGALKFLVPPDPQLV